MKMRVVAGMLAMGISIVHVFADGNQESASAADALIRLKLAKFTFTCPHYMKTSETPVGTAAESTNGIGFIASAYPTNQLSQAFVRQLTFGAFRKAVARGKDIQPKAERTVEREIMGQHCPGTHFADVYHGEPRTTEMYLFPDKGSTVVIILQHYDKDRVMAVKAFDAILKSLKMEDPQPATPPYSEPAARSPRR